MKKLINNIFFSSVFQRRAHPFDFVFLSHHPSRLHRFFPSYAVLSGSMEPTIFYGSLIYVKPQSVYAPGDIVTFRSASKPVKYFTHRIVSVSNGMAVTRGDANIHNDPEPVPLNRAQGELKFSIPFAGFLVTALENFWVKLAYALLLLFWLMLEISFTKARVLNAKQQKDKGDASDVPNPTPKVE